MVLDVTVLEEETVLSQGITHVDHLVLDRLEVRIPSEECMEK